MDNIVNNKQAVQKGSRMRRISGPQPGEGNFFIRKQASNKQKSPNIKKAKSKSKIKQQTSSHAIQRKTNSFSKSEHNQSSTFFTTKANKSKKSDNQKKKSNNLKKYEKQIMEILNASASKIQRQWRKYLIRKYKKQIQIKNRVNVVHKIANKQYDEQSVHVSQCSSFYNHAKYYSSQQEQFKKKAPTPPEFSHKNLFSFQLSSPNIQPRQLETVMDIKLQCHQRTKSDQTIPSRKIQYSQRAEDKVLQITPKIIDVHIQGEEKVENENKRGLQQLKFEQHYIRLEKSSIDEIVNKLESKLEEKKLKKMLSLENNLSNNLMTFRSYKKSIESINQQHKKKLSNLQNKKKRLFLKLTEFVKLCEKNFQDLDADGGQDINITKNEGDKNRNLNDFQISFTSDISGFQNVQVIMDDSDFQTPFSDKKIREKNDNHGEVFCHMKEKDDEIFIDDADRQNTLIHQLTSNEKDFQKFQQRSTLDRINNDEKMYSEAIYTPPKQNQLRRKLNPKILDDTGLEKIASEPIENIQSKKQDSIRSNINFKKIVKSDREIQQEIKKFYPINPHIEAVNHWLLQISHFILDHYGREFLQKLTNVEQPNPVQLLRQSRKRVYLQKQYTVISHQIFKSFEFYHIQSIVNDQNISEDKRQVYSVLLYTFHQALYDSLNRMLLDELIEGKNWIKYPWSSERKLKRSIGVEHSKQCLQKAINRVSNISDYNLLPLEGEIEKGRQFEHNQQNLIFAEQVKQICLFSQIQRGYILNILSQQVEQQILCSESETFFKYFF